MIDMTTSTIEGSSRVFAVDENGQSVEILLVEERALTIYIDNKEIVTLMTMGSYPELLVLGYLKNQTFFENIEDVKVVQVDWQTNAVAVVSNKKNVNIEKLKEHRTVTSGCGQGTMFGNVLESLKDQVLPQRSIEQSILYYLLNYLGQHNQVYKNAGAVHGCALCKGKDVLFFVEDVGRHNAVDTIAGHMWLNNIKGDDCIFYTTGRLTSEMVIKIAQMGVPILLSRSGATKMGFELAQQFGVTLISRAKGRHFQVLNGVERIVFDVPS
ncbi:MAG: formate dehydrogenase family accessory protein FdhD [Cycloclasticus sp. Phe_18]|jgi:FdhD protein|nr:MAG: formate dehydrogenase family accessory protein FdhD [Cycloclasticus sp. Phe_18]MDF1688203.1 formate dehydrogenase accessory sulfurtransferase FdhD [Cycloclasticus sp.]